MRRQRWPLTQKLIGTWWRPPLALVHTKTGLRQAQVGEAMGVKDGTFNKWCQARQTSSGVVTDIAAEGALLIQVLRHSTSDAGALFLRNQVLAALEIREPASRVNRFMTALYTTKPWPIDYSWARLIQTVQVQISAKGKLPKSCKDMNDWIDFVDVWSHPRLIANQLGLPDPGLPDWDDSQIHGETEWNRPPMPTNPYQSPPAPPAGTG